MSDCGHCPCYPITGSCCECEPVKHEDDSYGDCVICREYIPHTDDETRRVKFPCAVAREQEGVRFTEDSLAAALRTVGHTDHFTSSDIMAAAIIQAAKEACSE